MSDKHKEIVDQAYRKLRDGHLSGKELRTCLTEAYDLGRAAREKESQ